MFAYLNGVFPGSFVGIGTFCGSNLSLDHESGCIAMCKNPTVLEHASFHAAQYPSYQLDRDMPGGKRHLVLVGNVLAPKLALLVEPVPQEPLVCSQKASNAWHFEHLRLSMNSAMS